MKNTYQKPLVQLVFMDAQDVIATSNSLDNFMDFRSLRNLDIEWKEADYEKVFSICFDALYGICALFLHGHYTKYIQG